VQGVPWGALPLSLSQSIVASILQMYRGVATALVALAAFDYFYLDGKYLHHVQAVANSLLHFFVG
jgi:hypothetical protein